MARFQKGNPKRGGRKKGSLNKTTLKFRDRLVAHGLDIEKVTADAINAGNTELIRAIATILPYLTPRLKEQLITPETQAQDEQDDSELPISKDEFLKLLGSEPS